jgi:hypothetical protein
MLGTIQIYECVAKQSLQQTCILTTALELPLSTLNDHGKSYKLVSQSSARPSMLAIQ